MYNPQTRSTVVYNSELIMLAAASSFFGRTNISQSYNIGQSASSRPATPGQPGTSLNASTNFVPTLIVGLWKVQGAIHKVTNKRVSVWSFDKKGPDLERLGPAARERALEVMKTEASALGRLRHPSILGEPTQSYTVMQSTINTVVEMVEPVEETRTELIFATEPVLSSLELSISGGGRSSPIVELDEVEIQKGILQICKGLSFLHSSAQLIHTNINPETIILNEAGDWKISGLGLTIPLIAPGGNPSRWEFPTFDARVPAYIQRSFDYMAPEYALDEQLLTASDMYGLGCVIYAVHCKGKPPFRNHGSLGGLRDNSGKPLPGIESLDHTLQGLLKSLITRHANNRPTPSTLSSHPFFSSLPISTLNFLDRSNFTSKTREEKISFMKGLAGVLNNFSEGLRTRKILPSLVEEMKDSHLLPYILPNVFAISSMLTPAQFAGIVLPSLKPLFSVKEPPQNMLTLLDNLGMLQSKTDKQVFRERGYSQHPFSHFGLSIPSDVLPLVYNALESEHAIVQERALKTIPDLCETIDYAEVQGVLFPRVALVFTKTRILSVKVATLATFLTMVKTLDQTSLTQKLVPLLSRIRTKEPAVMEAMGFKVDREAVATLVLPQLWSMSMGPLLNVSQFQRFMDVIKKLGDRVEKEHNQFLRDSQRVEDRSALATHVVPGKFEGSVDFESLVGKANGKPSQSDPLGDTTASLGDDVWGSIFDENNVSKAQTPTLPFASPSVATSQIRTRQTEIRPPIASTPSSITSSPQTRGPQIGSRPLSTSSPLIAPPLNFSPSPRTSSAGHSHMQPAPPLLPLENVNHTPFLPSSTVAQQRPNYNISLEPTIAAQASLPKGLPVPLHPFQAVSQPPTFPSFAPPGMGTMLMPSKPAGLATGSSKQPSKDDWGDFDPLS
ncbi:hypothetical protein H0H93_009301 [Arthromyces matolae]|nr:hypothetical protein H0H93_009301 [Arthromyces matolae]